jgi:chromosome segregation ATPase
MLQKRHLYLFSRSSIRTFFAQLGAENLVFEPALFAHYDMFLVVSRVPLAVYVPDEVTRALHTTPGGRLMQAWLDLDEQRHALQERYKAAETDRVARRADIERLEQLLAESERDRAARLGVIEAQGAEIARLYSQLQQGQADNQTLQQQLLEAERDRVAQRQHWMAETQTLQQGLAGAERDLAAQRALLDQHEETIYQYVGTIQQHEETIYQYAGTIQQHEKTIQQYEKTIQQYEKTIQQHEETIQQYEKTIQQHEKTIQQHEKTIQQYAECDWTAQRQHWMAENQTLQQGLAGAERDLAAQRALLDQHAETLEQYKETIYQCAETIHQYAEALSRLQTDRERIWQTLLIISRTRAYKLLRSLGRWESVAQTLSLPPIEQPMERPLE